MVILDGREIDHDHGADVLPRPDHMLAVPEKSLQSTADDIAYVCLCQLQEIFLQLLLQDLI